MKKGFTLLELLIVVVILGVLALIAAPALLNAADEARNGAVRANVSAAASSVTSRMALSGGMTATQIATQVAGDLNANNSNPVTGVAQTAFSDAGGAAAGVVDITGDDNADTVTIVGYDKDSAALVTKVIAAPSDANAAGS